MMGLVLAMAQAVAAPTPAMSPPGDTIVVTGRRLSDTERALADCIARGCPPKEEIDASLAHAENQFVAGDYAASRRTLLSARSRNAKYAKELPVDVADLMRANGRLASLNGLSDSARINSIDSLDVLRDGLDPNDPRVLMQRLLVGDSFVKEGRFDAARELYDTVARHAKASGQRIVEGHALFRTAVVYAALASVDTGYSLRAKRIIRQIRATTDPDFAPFREGVDALERRLSAGNAVRDVEKAELAKTPAAARTNVATLVYAPPIDLPAQADSLSTTVPMTGDATPQWADFAFRVAPDGTVRDIEIVRRSDNAGGKWLTLVEKSMAQRLYRPLAMAASEPGLRRIERYSLVYDRTMLTGSNVRQRSPKPRIETTDLTVDSAAG